MTPAELYDRTFRPRHAIERGRQWLIRVTSDKPEISEKLWLLNEVGVIAMLDVLHSRGWEGFARDEGLWSGLTPRERAEERENERIRLRYHA